MGDDFGYSDSYFSSSSSSARTVTDDDDCPSHDHDRRFVHRNPPPRSRPPVTKRNTNSGPPGPRPEYAGPRAGHSSSKDKNRHFHALMGLATTARDDQERAELREAAKSLYGGPACPTPIINWPHGNDEKPDQEDASPVVFGPIAGGKCPVRMEKRGDGFVMTPCPEATEEQRVVFRGWVKQLQEEIDANS